MTHGYRNAGDLFGRINMSLMQRWPASGLSMELRYGDFVYKATLRDQDRDITVIARYDVSIGSLENACTAEVRNIAVKILNDWAGNMMDEKQQYEARRKIVQEAYDNED